MEFYKETWFIVIMLFICFPIGLYLIWRHKTEWTTKFKIIITIAFLTILILFLCIYFIGSTEKQETNSKNTDIDVYFDEYVTNNSDVSKDNNLISEDDYPTSDKNSTNQDTETSNEKGDVSENISSNIVSTTKKHDKNTSKNKNEISTHKTTTTKNHKETINTTKPTTTVRETSNIKESTTKKSNNHTTTSTTPVTKPTTVKETKPLVTETASSSEKETVTGSKNDYYDLNTIVYVSGKYYHFEKDCAGTYEVMTLEDAMDLGKKPCRDCVLVHYQ